MRRSQALLESLPDAMLRVGVVVLGGAPACRALVVRLGSELVRREVAEDEAVLRSPQDDDALLGGIGI